MKNRPRFLTPLLMCILLPGCQHLGDAAADYRSRENDVVGIYRLFLTEWTTTSKRTVRVAVSANAPEPDIVASIPECAGVDAHWLPPKPIPDLTSILGRLENVQLTSNYYRHQLMKRDLMTLSAISFDETHQIAALNYSYYCGGLCGDGATVIFKKVQGAWVRSKRECNGWIS